jgi:hypothetical protein
VFARHKASRYESLLLKAKIKASSFRRESEQGSKVDKESPETYNKSDTKLRYKDIRATGIGIISFVKSSMTLLRKDTGNAK